MDFKDFAEPAAILRPAPFWAINSRIEPGETARQMADMISKGLSGGFFHSRAGLVTDYLGEEWVASMRAALEVAKSQDGYLWLYDEDLWPSGNAGGQVAAAKDEYRETILQAEFVPAGAAPVPPPESTVAAVYAVERGQGNTLTGWRRLEPGAGPAGDCLVLHRRYMPKTSWWSGESYANLLHPEVTQKFIELTHEVYKKHFAAEFGRRIPGIFTDEPNIYGKLNGIAWYDGLPDIYRASSGGRDLWQDLPLLFFDGGDARLIRLLFYRMLLQTFCRHFAKPLYEWCEKNNLELTGHYLSEDSLQSQIAALGGGVMAFYRWQQLPGIDHLCRGTASCLLTIKQVASAVRQLGRRAALTEIFGVSHHTNTFEDFKWIGDYNLALGAVFFCPHLTWYSMAGKRKRDYPPNWNYQQTYWPHLRPLNDYFARCAAVLTAGRADVEVLVLHPVEAASCALRRSGVEAPANPVPAGLTPANTAEVAAMDRSFRLALKTVLDLGYDADLGDEGYIEDLGRVENGRFVIGQASYGVVVVPEAPTWRPRTYALLGEFVRSGGRLIFSGRVPGELDCAPAAEAWRELASLPGVVCAPENSFELQNAVDAAVEAGYRLRGLDGRPKEDVFAHVRRDGGKRYFFISNSGRGEARQMRLTIEAAAGERISEWEPLTGARKSCECRRDRASGAVTVEFELAPCGSLLLAVGDETEAADSAKRPRPRPGCRTLPLAERWEFSRTEPNVLVLDRVAYSLDEGASFTEFMPEYEARRRIAEHFGTAESLRWQPWVAVRKKLFDGRGGPLRLRYQFHNWAVRAGRIHAVVENLRDGRLLVNGRGVDTAGCGWHWDHAFGKVEITSLLQPGLNTLDFSLDYSFLSEVESAYLVGDFGVRLRTPREGELCDEPAELRSGSWLGQGYPFYPGAMVYRTVFSLGRTHFGRNKRLLLRLLNPSGILYLVRVNDAPQALLPWHPYELDISGMARPGENRLEIEVVASPQNAYGPIHAAQGDGLRWGGANAFEAPYLLRPEFSLFDYGLLGGAELVLA